MNSIGKTSQHIKGNHWAGRIPESTVRIFQIDKQGVQPHLGSGLYHILNFLDCLFLIDFHSNSLCLRVLCFSRQTLFCGFNCSGKLGQKLSSRLNLCTLHILWKRKAGCRSIRSHQFCFCYLRLLFFFLLLFDFGHRLCDFLLFLLLCHCLSEDNNCKDRDNRDYCHHTC
ncbi:unknown [Clostridium sp. CAG:242]|nr:unknown [Clostridium sp. CAG:242]